MFLESENKLRDHLVQLKKDANYQTDLFAKQPTNHFNYENEASSGSAGGGGGGGDGVCDMDDDLNNPTVDASNNLRWKCSKCPKAFGRRIELQLHRHIHRIETKPLPPPIDDDEPNGLGFYAEEMHIKTEPEAYDSDNLDETIQSHFMDMDMDMDMSTNSLPNGNGDELRWTCTTCKAKFLRRAHLRAHRQHHVNQRKDGKNVNFKTKHHHIPQPQTIEKVFKSEMISAAKSTAMGVLANAIKFGNNGKSSMPKTKAKTKTITTSAIANDLSAELNRWMCRKCSIPFRTRRLLRDHNLIHRSSGGINSSMNSTAESSVLDDLIDIQAAVDADERKTLLSMTPKKSAPRLLPPPPPKNCNTTMATVTGQPNKSFKCQKCRKGFENATKLKRHKMFSHTFEIKLNLKSAPKHISNAMKKIPHDIMSKKKSSTMSRSPFVEREWACTSCSRVFGRRQLLREHRRDEHMLKPNGLPLKHEQNAAVKEEQSADEGMVLDSDSIIE